MPIHVVEGAPKSDCHQYQCPWVSCSRPLALLGDLSTLAHRSGSASYQITALLWVPVPVRLCVLPLQVKCLFPLVLWDS